MTIPLIEACINGSVCNNTRNSQNETRTQYFSDAPRIFGLLISISVIVLNVVEIIIISRIKRRKSIYEILLLSLSTADCLFGLINSIQQITKARLSPEDVQIVAEIMGVFYFFFIFSSLNHLLLISTNRLWAITAPIKHRVVLTRNRLHISIGCIWLSATIVTTAIFLDAFLNKDERQRQLIVNRTKRSTSIMVLVSDTLFVLINITIICLVRKTKATVDDEHSSSQTRSMERAVQRICTAIIVIFIVFTSPWAILECMGSEPLWTHMLLILNSGVNSIVYFFKGYISRLR